LITTIRDLHNWDITPSEAVELQRQLRDRVEIPRTTTTPKIKTIAGLDCAFDRQGNQGYAGIVVYGYPDMKEIQRVGRRSPLTFPYVPGLLSFREVPLLLAALEKLDTLPDAFMVDGHGLAHPRRFGLACHFGLLVEPRAADPSR
jgi:deoxyribonuclease V